MYPYFSEQLMYYRLLKLMVVNVQCPFLPLCSVQKHRNPCFYKASGKEAFSILPKDVWQELHNGDLISLLPDDLVFRVVEESPADLER